MIEILRKLTYSWNFNGKITQDIIEYAIEETKVHIRELKRMSKPLKLYL